MDEAQKGLNESCKGHACLPNFLKFSTLNSIIQMLQPELVSIFDRSDVWHPTVVTEPAISWALKMYEKHACIWRDMSQSEN